MPFVKCSVDGCSRKLQPVQKLDPRDRETWVYRNVTCASALLASSTRSRSNRKSSAIVAAGTWKLCPDRCSTLVRIGLIRRAKGTRGLRAPFFEGRLPNG